MAEFLRATIDESRSDTSATSFCRRDMLSIQNGSIKIDLSAQDCDILFASRFMTGGAEETRDQKDMHQLYLFRHAKTEPGRPGQEDHDRALSNRGWDDAPMVMRRFLSLSDPPDLILCSTARRCKQTVEAVEDMLSGTPVKYLEDLYLAEDDLVHKLAEKAADETGAERVLVVGHNPGLRGLAGRLCPMGTPRAGAIRASFPTSSIAGFERTDDSDTSWRLIIFLKVSELKDAE